jgi:hypothetical protein
VFDDSFAEVFPTLKGMTVARLVRFGVEDVGTAEVWAEGFCDVGPSHEFGNCELFQELSFHGHERVAAVFLNAVEEIGLFIVVWSEDDIVDDALESLVKG